MSQSQQNISFFVIIKKHGTLLTYFHPGIVCLKYKLFNYPLELKKPDAHNDL